MKVCLDVHYRAERACAAAVVFREWLDPDPFARFRAASRVDASYRPGRFFERELAPLMTVIRTLPRSIEIELIVVDGYCQLTPEGKPGLGAHLHASLQAVCPVVGVAKNRYRTASHAVPVFRGSSRRPLFVTAVELDADEAARSIGEMAGRYRIPTLLKEVDALAREGCQGPGPPA